MADERNGEAPGRVVQVIGPVVDVEFPPESLPEINTALELERTLDGDVQTIVCEVAQHIGESIVRAIAMKPTDGVVRGATVQNTGRPITMPVGPQVLGHVYNVIGDPLDIDRVEAEDRWPIHRDAPKFEDLEPKTEMFETGIKVIDLLAPFTRGGKVGIFGGAGVGKTVLIDAFREGSVDQIHAVYTDFRSAFTLRPVDRRLVPIAPEEVAGGEADRGEPRPEYIFEPAPAQLLDALLPRYVTALIFAAMLESAASESAARRRAMKAATENAEDLIRRLTREANRARQTEITTELMEIVGGAEALRQASGE